MPLSRSRPRPASLPCRTPPCRPPPRRLRKRAAHRSRRPRRCGDSAPGGAPRARRVLLRSCRDRRQADRSTASSRHACSRTARSRRTSGRARRDEAIGAERAPCRRALRARRAEQAVRCISRKFSIGKVASRSCLRGAGREHAPAEAARLGDQRGLLLAEPEGVGREDRCVFFIASMAFMPRRISAPSGRVKKVEHRRVEGRAPRGSAYGRGPAGTHSARRESFAASSPPSLAAHCGHARPRGKAPAL